MITENDLQSRVEITPINGSEIEINMGPHHPSTHGVIRFILFLDGEIVVRAVADVGYLHRSIEKIAENLPYPMFMPYTDRVDYVAAINCNLGYALAVESLAGLEVPERATWLRMIGAELNRINSHLIAVGALAMDVGATTPFVHAIREREYILDLLEILTGTRMNNNYVRFGGVCQDVPEDFFKKTEKFLDHFVLFLGEFNRLLTTNKIFLERLINVGILTGDQALGFSFSGPNLRASGVGHDLRRIDPYCFYSDMEFSVPVGSGVKGTTGDSFDRFIVRIDEMLESVKILRQIMSKIKEGPIQSKIPRKIVLPAGESYHRSEAPRGELGFHIVSDGKSNMPYRIKIRTGSFAAMTSLSELFKGMMVADVVAYFASLDVVAPEVDR
ncbi:MAG: NADH-quinone oxidoreductase subunit D [Spirochaetia bacterium]|nr:NADH-quinone oxidoreductase subunit D [Spirochaetia bacterium]